MRVFLDTNVILDLLLERDGFEDGVAILQMNDDGKITTCISALTVMNVAFVYKKTVGNSLVVPNVKQLVSLMEVIPLDSDIIEKSIYLDGKDYEDIVQYVSAVKGGCDCIISRNTKHFHISSGLAGDFPRIPVYTPGGFLYK